MDYKKVVKYCNTQAIRKWKVAKSLYKAKHYADCLFYCHLVLEMLLKGKVVEATKKQFPITHDLIELSKKSLLTFDNKQLNDLEEISTFNIAGRYDDYKYNFYRKATPVFTKKYYSIVKKLIVWLKKH